MHDRPGSAAGWLLWPLEYVGQVVGLAAEAAGYIIRGGISYRQTIDQMAHTGFSSLPLVIVTLGFTGMVMAFHAGEQAPKLSADAVVGWLVAEAMCRELGPVLVSIVVAARVGSAIAAELGTMKVTEQIDALRSMATSPIQYLVVPRLIACLVMVPSLAIVGDVAGVYGGWVFTWNSDYLTSRMYFASIWDNLELSTATAGIAKSVFFGLIIAVVGCHQGLYCRMDSEDVGRATYRSVVYAMLGIFVSDYFLTKMLFR